MATQTINDQALIELIFEIFREHGYEGTSISQLSEATGLKKSSLYHRFPEGKDDMLKAVVNHVAHTIDQTIIRILQNSQLSPLDRFTSMSSTIKQFYACGTKNCLLNVLNLGNAKPEIKRLLKKIYDGWLQSLTKLGVDAGMSSDDAANWSEYFIVTLEGILVIQRLSDNSHLFENWVAKEQLKFRH